MLQTEAAVRRTGALVALTAACGLVVVVLAPPVAGSSYAVLAIYAVYLLGCAAVFLSPAHRVVSELWTARVFLLEKRSCFSAASWHAGACAPWQTEAGMRRTGALVALGAASVLVLVPAVQELHHGVLAVYAILQLGCAAVLLSPAHRAVAELARRAAQATRKPHGASARANTVLRWAGFTCIAFCAAGDMRAAEEVNSLLLFLLFLVGVWTVSLSMLAANHPTLLPLSLPRPPAAAAAAVEKDRDGGKVNIRVPAAARGAVASKDQVSFLPRRCSPVISQLRSSRD